MATGLAAEFTYTLLPPRCLFADAQSMPETCVGSRTDGSLPIPASAGLVARSTVRDHLPLAAQHFPSHDRQWCGAGRPFGTACAERVEWLRGIGAFDRDVIGQDQSKRVVAVAVYSHFLERLRAAQGVPPLARHLRRAATRSRLRPRPVSCQPVLPYRQTILVVEVPAPGKRPDTRHCVG